MAQYTEQQVYDYLALGNFEEMSAAYQQQEQERRRLFFEALGIEDDGRRNPCMTREEFVAFSKGRKWIDADKVPYKELKSKARVEVFFEFEPYHDVSYTYCKEDDTIYESRFYIGE